MDGKNPLIEPWTNAACLGYVISALENLGYKHDQIHLVTAEMRELFDWVSVDEAKDYYNGGHF
jgi:Holliday junction resolvasome RuvABC DNA-binding subunit